MEKSLANYIEGNFFTYFRCSSTTEERILALFDTKPVLTAAMFNEVKSSNGVIIVARESFDLNRLEKKPESR